MNVTPSPLHLVTPSPCHPLPCHFRITRFAEHGDFDFAGEGEPLLEGVDDVAADLGGRFVAGVLGADDDAELAAGLDGVGLLDAGELAGDGLRALPSA